MKALELADKLDTLENFYAESSFWYDHAACNAVFAASDELRRLAEVNAELVEALDVAKQYLLKRVAGTGGEGETKVLPTITSAIAKAKEQQ